MNCPSCRQPMVAEIFPREHHGELTLDVCYRCHVIWFDQFESAALTPAGVITLFRKLHQHREDERLPLATRVGCVRCQAELAPTHDVTRGGRIHYFRCPTGHGRLTAFVQFLREKQFIRNVTNAELAQLKAEVKQVRCSSCGGPIDLARESACGYCKAPISVLDADAVEKTLLKLDQLEAARGKVNPEKLVALQREDAARRKMLARMSGKEAGWAESRMDSSSGINSTDLVVGGIGILLALLN
jgi:Zn-finger nucleic acid-binding protein